MKLTNENLNILPEKEQNLARALLMDIDELNQILSKNLKDKVAYLDWQDYHDRYSPERTDPCPNFYGCYCIMINDEQIGDKLKIQDIDYSIYELISYTKIIFENHG